MQAVNRFEPRGASALLPMRSVDQGFDSGLHLAILVVVKIGTLANQKKLFFKLRSPRPRSPLWTMPICALSRSRR